MRKIINQKYFNSFADELLGKFKRINHLTSTARVSIGNYHEEILRIAIRNFLSKRYSVKTGYIYFDQDNISNQIDILIIDENYSFSYLFQEGDFTIVKPDSVVCAIEVKSKINANNFPEAILNIAKAKELKYKTKTGQLLGCIFGYESPVITPYRMDKYFKSKKLSTLTDSIHLWPDQIIFFQKGEMLKLLNDPKNNSKKYFYHIKKNVDNSLKEKRVDLNRSSKFSIFISHILGALGRNEISVSSRFVRNEFEQLIDMDGLFFDETKRFIIGKGLINRIS